MSWPTTKEPRENFVTIRLTDAEAADVAWLQGVINAKDRSKAVRQCVDRVVAAEKRRAARQKSSDTAAGPAAQDGE